MSQSRYVVSNEGDPETRKRGSRNDTFVGVQDTEMKAKRGRGNGGEIIKDNKDFSTDYFVLKMLCPLTSCGPIIGKGGSVIAEMHKSTGARIILSNSNDFYPGTVDRVIAISGLPENVSAAIETLVLKLIESQESEQRSNRSPHQKLVVRLLIANAVAGIVIGKGGATIKHLMSSTGCKVMLSDVSESYGTSERILTIQGNDIANITSCAQDIFNRIQVTENCGYVNFDPSYVQFEHPSMEEPQPSTRSDYQRPSRFEYQNPPRVQYQDPPRDPRYLPSPPSHYPPMAPPPPPVYSRDEVYERPSYSYDDVRSRSPPPYLPTTPAYPPASVSYRGEGERDRRGGGATAYYPPPPVSYERAPPVSYERAPPVSYERAPPVSYERAPPVSYERAPPVSYERAPPVSYERAPPVSYERAPPVSYERAPPRDLRRKPKGADLDEIGVSLPRYATDGLNIVMTIGIPDDFIGLIVGKGGVVINELKEKTGAIIKISNKSEYMPGTNQRKVTVTGRQHQVQQAHSLMLSKLISPMR